MERWTRFVLRHRWAVLGTWLVVFLVAGFASSRLAGLLTNRFTLPGTDAERAEQKAKGQENALQQGHVSILVPRPKRWQRVILQRTPRRKGWPGWPREEARS